MWSKFQKFLSVRKPPPGGKPAAAEDTSAQVISTDSIFLRDISGLYGTVRLRVSGDDKKYFVTSFDAQFLSFAAMAGFNTDSLDACHEGELLFEHNQFSVWIRFVDRQQNIIKCQLVRTPDSWRDDIDEYRDPIQLGKKLIEIDETLIQQAREGEKMRWFRSGPTCDVYLFEDHAQDASVLQIWWEKNLVEWSREHGLRSGSVVDAKSSEDSVVYKPSDSFLYHGNPDENLLHWASRFVSASILPKPTREFFPPTRI